VTTKKECLGKYDYSREECYICPLRVECMLKKFQNSDEVNIWSDNQEKPNCYGSYRGRADCRSCPYRKECSRVSTDIIRGKTQKQRYVSKYKGRGKQIERDIY
jgi:hypothetical protein